MYLCYHTVGMFVKIFDDAFIEHDPAHTLFYITKGIFNKHSIHISNISGDRTWLLPVCNINTRLEFIIHTQIPL